MFEWYKKEKPVFTGIARGVGGFGFGGSSSSTRPISFSATGGDVSALSPGNGYTYHTFTGPGTFVVSGSSKTAELLLVGGGGAGGTGNSSRSGGGGGAGGVVNGNMTFTPGTYTITVGAGAGRAGAPASNGGNTTIIFGSVLVTALGGGKGAQYDNQPAPNGGSGGGQVAFNTGSPAVGSGIQPSQSQPGLTAPYTSTGNPGGASFGDASGGGGGGGAVGGNAGPPTRPGTAGFGGNGGNGLQYPNFTGPLIGVPSLAPLSGYFAGGGGGGSRNTSYTPGNQTGGTGGLGGGGIGGITSGTQATAGTINSGGGGGGSGGDGGQAGQPGGDGIVIIRYLI